jgi:hypothetical protein
MVAKITRARHMAKTKGRVGRATLGKLTPAAKRLAHARAMAQATVKKVAKFAGKKRKSAKRRSKKG